MPTTEQPEPTQPTDDYLVQKIADQSGGIAQGAKTATGLMAEARKLNQFPWDALTTGQQVERMREVVKQLEHTNQYYSRRLQELTERIAALEEHDHAGGKVMIPVISKPRGGGYGEGAMEEKVANWF